MVSTTSSLLLLIWNDSRSSCTDATGVTSCVEGGNMSVSSTDNNFANVGWTDARLLLLLVLLLLLLLLLLVILLLLLLLLLLLMSSFRMAST